MAQLRRERNLIVESSKEIEKQKEFLQSIQKNILLMQKKNDLKKMENEINDYNKTRPGTFSSLVKCGARKIWGW